MQKNIVKSSYKRWGFINFFNQGDREIIAGRQPVPIMNRIYTDQQALHQVCRIVHLSGTIDARNHATSPSPDSYLFVCLYVFTYKFKLRASSFFPSYDLTTVRWKVRSLTNLSTTLISLINVEGVQKLPNH